MKKQWTLLGTQIHAHQSSLFLKFHATPKCLETPFPSPDLWTTRFPHCQLTHLLTPDLWTPPSINWQSCGTEHQLSGCVDWLGQLPWSACAPCHTECPLQPSTGDERFPRNHSCHPPAAPFYTGRWNRKCVARHTYLDDYIHIRDGLPAGILRSGIIICFGMLGEWVISYGRIVALSAPNHHHI